MDNHELIRRFKEINHVYNSLISVINGIYKYKEKQLHDEYLNEHCDIEVGDIVFGDGMAIIVRDIRIVIEYDKLRFVYIGEQLRKNLTIRHGLYFDIKNVEKVIKKNRL